MSRSVLSEKRPRATPASDRANSSQLSNERSEKNVREKMLKTPRLVKKEGEEVVQVSEQRFP